MGSIRLLAVLAGLAFASSGCAISESIGSISDSVSSPFESSSRSSDGGGAAYQRDVSELTLAFARQGGDLDGFRGGVRTLAEERGITLWQEDALTCASIGRGIRQAQWDEVAALDFGAKLFGADADALAAYRSGYASIQ